MGDITLSVLPTLHRVSCSFISFFVRGGGVVYVARRLWEQGITSQDREGDVNMCVSLYTSFSIG